MLTIIGDTIAADPDNICTVTTLWMPREGDSLLSTFEVIAVGGGAIISVQLMHKNSEDTGGGTANGAAESQTAAGTYSFIRTGCKQLVRYQAEISCDAGIGALVGWVHWRMLVPAWLATGVQSSSRRMSQLTGYLPDDSLRMMQSLQSAVRSAAAAVGRG